ncbi:MAG: hypothetical protein CMH54_13415 [Myxococcales bacterium]|mgnify:CR=1 FL=1|nr:hypothetical protein [Myxococcales bacterium]
MVMCRMTDAAEIDHSKLVRAVPLLEGLHADAITEIVGVSRLYHAREGSILFNAGDHPLGLLFLISGRAKVVHTLPSNDVLTVSKVDAGHVVGGEEFLTGTPYSYRAVMMNDGLIFRVEMSGFEELRKAGHGAVSRLSRVLAVELEQNTGSIAERIHGIFSKPENALPHFEALTMKHIQTAKI